MSATLREARQRAPRTHVQSIEDLPDMWAAPIEEWHAELLLDGHTRATVDVYARHLRTVATALHARHERPWDVRGADLNQWLAERGWSRATQSRVSVSVRNFYAWSVRTGYCSWSPAAGLGVSDRRRPGPTRRRLPEAWLEPLDTYLNHMRAGARSENTIENRLQRLAQLCVVSADPWTITTDQLAEWLSNPEWAPETKRSARGAVSSFYAWAVRSDRLEKSPALDLPRVLVPRSLPRPAPTAAIQEAFRRADDRQRIAIKLAAYAGLRRAEIARLHCRDIGAHSLHVTGKGGHDRRVPLHPDLASELAAELIRRRDGRQGSGFPAGATSEGYLFPSAQRAGMPLTPAHVGRIVTDCLPEGWTTHTLRHRFATNAYAADRDLRAVQELLGHRRPETTARYAAAPSDALARAVMAIELVPARRTEVVR